MRGRSRSRTWGTEPEFRKPASISPGAFCRGHLRMFPPFAAKLARLLWTFDGEPLKLGRLFEPDRTARRGITATLMATVLPRTSAVGAGQARRQPDRGHPEAISGQVGRAFAREQGCGRRPGPQGRSGRGAEFRSSKATFRPLEVSPAPSVLVNRAPDLAPGEWSSSEVQPFLSNLSFAIDNRQSCATL